jgi:peptidoglycan hydrolase CwlO-like protein
MNESDCLKHIGKQDEYIEELITEIDGMKEKIDELQERIKELEKLLGWANPSNWKPDDL